MSFIGKATSSRGNKGAKEQIEVNKKNKKRLLANNNLKHSAILNSIVTLHNINTIYQVISTIIGKSRQPVVGEARASRRRSRLR